MKPHPHKPPQKYPAGAIAGGVLLLGGGGHPGGNSSSTPISPPSGPAQWLFQEPPAHRPIPSPLLPRYAADPFILRSTEGWWLFASHEADDGRRIPIYHSRDLIDWTFVRGAVAPGPYPDSWNRRNFWAPEVALIDGRYHLYYTAMPDGLPGNEGNRIGLAVADHPAGPYEDRGVVVPYAAIDGSPYRHADGSWWLYFTVEYGNSLGLVPGSLGVHRLLAPDRVDTTPRILIHHHEWQEAPCIFPCGDRLVLLFSTGSWENDTYGVRWATGAAPEGPFVEQTGLLLQTTATLKGPGHCNIFPGPDGSPWLVHHAWDPAHTARYPHIRPLDITVMEPACANSLAMS